ncbi:murein L,D-transpeptidase catalytic domain family protein [Rhodocytophaga rosea]|uniref:Murein L,D-transpeptidase catalytic domain family protein n=1 Tax=Rhodocytophaga rosea TaxID=2704465 RepID=A0A6C0GH51_9BACT|nr:murein L,D-transpeptidase catalytic domain family protein [Rhodocytophaga rosea]QHT67144.1 murein L,D-transpeptidase catalytic domain family protein [Rhodocytophaga rosea]
MQRKAIILFILSLFISISIYAATPAPNGGNGSEAKVVLFENHIHSLYRTILFKKSKPSFELFRKSYVGYLNLKAAGKLSDKNILTIIDFRLSSTKNRLWTIDLNKKRVVYESLVAHGRNTGDEYAKNFSNEVESNMSSFGFYVTGDTYIGKHGLSLYLDGADEGFNCNARTRSVVMHSADYVTESFINKTGRLGRSLGCPAIPIKNHKEVISTLMDKTCLFIYFPDSAYEKKSRLLAENTAMDYFLVNQSVTETSATMATL